MMKQFMAVITIFTCLSFMAGCASVNGNDTKYHEPLNKMQQEYYDVETFFESRKYSETVIAGESFLRKYQRDVLSAAVRYYVASAHQKTGNEEEAKKLYEKIIETNPSDNWGKLATVGLQEIE